MKSSKVGKNALSVGGWAGGAAEAWFATGLGFTYASCPALAFAAAGPMYRAIWSDDPLLMLFAAGWRNPD